MKKIKKIIAIAIVLLFIVSVNARTNTEILKVDSEYTWGTYIKAPSGEVWFSCLGSGITICSY